ncbi:unnamed protein product, partial [Cyprideis torosa]
TVQGGVGDVKAAGNYAASLLAQKEAEAMGCDQVLWLDCCERKYVEEVGTSNIFFVLDDILVTPPLSGTIMPGITRDSVLALAKDRKVEVQERPIAIEEVLEGCKSGRLRESFASGTAAVISPVGAFQYRQQEYIINENEVGPLTKEFYQTLLALQTGATTCEHKWQIRVC